MAKMAWPVHFRSIRSKLIVAVLTAFTPLAVLHFIAYCRHYNSRKELILESRAALANSVAAAITTFIEGVVSSHGAVARTIERGAGEKALIRYLNSICAAHPGMESCSIIAEDGSLMCAYPANSVSQDVARRPEVIDVLKGSMLSVSGVSEGKDGSRTFGVASLVTPQGEKPVVVRSVIKADSLMGLIPLKELYNVCIVVVDAEGRSVVRSWPAREMVPQKNWRQYSFTVDALDGRDASVTNFRPSENLNLMGHVAPIRRIKWAVAVLDPEDRSMAPVRNDLIWFVVSVFVTTLGLVGMLSLGNRISTPIRRLSRGAAALAVGDLRRRIDIHTGDEIESLAESFNTMGESLERHDKELTDKTAALEGLFRVAQAVTSSMDLDEILKSLVTVTSEVMGAHACAIFLVGDDEKLTVRESYNLSEEFKASLQLNLGQGCVGRAIQERHWTVSKDEQTQEDLPNRELALAEGLASALSAPLLAGKTAFGALTIWTSFPTEFTPLQIDLLCSIASHASTVIQNAELYVKEFNIAETLQSSLIGDIPSRLRGLQFGSRYYPALDDLRVGGDFYDVVQLPGGRVGVVIADVSGKGLQAAIHTAMCKYMLRGFAFSQPDSPGAALEALNDALCHFAENKFFVTAFYAVIDPESWTMTCANAGHPPPVMITRGGKQQIMLYKTGTPLGFESGAKYGERVVKLETGCGMFLYTDGIVEARGGEGMLDIEGLQNLLFSVNTTDPQELATRICEDVASYSKGRRRDDVAVVAFARVREQET